jgi:hypothetical protein
MTKDTGWPAFPVVVPNEQSSIVSDGMTLRDWFAGQALASIAYDYNSEEPYLTNLAKTSYAYADALIAERSKVQS